MKRLVNEIVKKYLALRMHRIESWMKRPDEVQERRLFKNLDAARNTEQGRKYDFGRIRSYERFASSIPVREYEDFRADIRRMMLGESNVLWPGRISWYSKSSGTTSDKSKFIPVPYGNLYGCHIAGSWDAMSLLYHNRPDMEIFRRKNVLLPGSFQSLPEYPHTRFGDISALMAYHMPAIGKAFYAVDFDTALGANFEEKIEKIARQTAWRDDIAMFGGVPTWLIVLFRRILEITGKRHMLEVWPHLQAYMHGGVGFEPYRQIFRELIPHDNFAYQEIYNASEGFFGAQCDLHVNDMLLLADNGVFYEFVPVEFWNDPFPHAATISDVQIGKNYALVITANNGLIRYQTGDTIVFTRKNPHCFRITGRTKQFINAFGEEVMIGDTDKALAETCSRFDAVVNEYTAAPLYFSNAQNGRGGHEWVIEFAKAPGDIELFNHALDQNLQRINSDYEAKRFRDMALDRLRMHVVPPGTFVRWLQERGKLGSQSKVPRLANHREYVEEILRIAGF